MSTVNTDTNTGTKPKTSTSTSTKPKFNSEEMFKNAKKGDILIAGEEHEIVNTGPGKYGRMISIMHEEKRNLESEVESDEKSKKESKEKIEVELYFTEIYQSLRMFVPDKGWETFPGSTNFKIKSVTK